MDVLGNIFSNIIWFIFAFWAIGAAGYIAAQFYSCFNIGLHIFLGWIVAGIAAAIILTQHIWTFTDIRCVAVMTLCSAVTSLILLIISKYTV